MQFQWKAYVISFLFVWKIMANFLIQISMELLFVKVQLLSLHLKKNNIFFSWNMWYFSEIIIILHMQQMAAYLDV